MNNVNTQEAALQINVCRRTLLKGLGAVAGASALSGCALPRIRSKSEFSAYADKCLVDGHYSSLACVSNRGDFYVKGFRTLGEPKAPVTPQTLFDLASIGKTHTAALCALLHAEGRLDVAAPFTEYLTDHVLAKEGCRITVRDLATHSGGFDNSKPYMTEDSKKMFSLLMAKRPVYGRGEKYVYACSNFVYLGLIVERLTGLDLDAAARKMLWGPLGMTRTSWRTVTSDKDVAEYPPSTYSGPHRRIGERNDICAHYAARPMGNGANFSTANDMLLFVDDLARRERFSSEYYDLLFTPSFTGDGHRRSFGWDMTAPKSTFSDWVSTGFSSRAICHPGWTGGVIAIDPETGFAGVVLGNRLSSKEKTMPLRMKLLDLMAKVLGRSTPLARS